MLRDVRGGKRDDVRGDKSGDAHDGAHEDSRDDGDGDERGVDASSDEHGDERGDECGDECGDEQRCDGSTESPEYVASRSISLPAESCCRARSSGAYRASSSHSRWSYPR